MTTHTTRATRLRRRGWARWLMVALLVVPVIEVYIILKVGQSIGGWETFGLLVLWSALGAWIVKREAGHAFSALRGAFRTGRMPAHELADAALVLIGGTLLLAPGFLTDAIGLVVLLPFTRPLTRRWLERAVTSRLFTSVGVSPFGAFTGVGGSAGQPASAGQPSEGPYPTSSSFSTGWGAHASQQRSSDGPRAGRARRAEPTEVVEGEIVE